ncbi:MAG: hypothetical protein ACI85I_001934 [Arenicella sp.]|jgi:hypothetical protein
MLKNDTINYMKILNKITLLFACSLLVFACSQRDRDRIGKNLDLLPPAQGGKGEVLIIMDSTKWNDTLGVAVRKVFHEIVPALPQAEPMFDITSVTASLFRGLLKQHRNIIVVTTFDSKTNEAKYLQANFTAESKKKIFADTSSYILIKEHEYAKGQTIMHLFATTEKDMISKLQQHKAEIQNYFNLKEENAIKKRLFNVLDKDLMKLFDAHNVKVKLPLGYRFAQDTTNFLWVRYPELRFDKNVFLANKPYTSESQFETKNIIAWRDSIAKEHLYGDPDNPNSFVRTENLEPVVAQEVTFDGKYAKQIRGRWKTNNISMGGSFISYTFADEATGQIYYLEAFLYAPGQKKREYMRELTTTLKSVKMD